MEKRRKIIPYRKDLRTLARVLRKNSTPGEIALWLRMRRKQLGVQFNRQVPIDKYIVDFYCHALSLAIEIDGGTHNHPEQLVEDEARQCRLESLGIHFLRFRELEVMRNTNSVAMTILDTIEQLQEDHPDD